MISHFGPWALVRERFYMRNGLQGNVEIIISRVAAFGRDLRTNMRNRLHAPIALEDRSPIGE